MRLTTTLLAILATIFSALPSANAETNYAERAGAAVGVYRDETLNFELDLESTNYRVVDFTDQVPDASFAAMRFDPLVFTMVVVEDLGTEMPVEQYAEIVKTATLANLRSGEGSSTVNDIETLAEREVDGVRALQLGFSGLINGTDASYVITTFVNGTMAYQVTTFASSTDAEQLRVEADMIAGSFSFPGTAPLAAADVKLLGEYRSDTFAYAFDEAADAGIWFAWADFQSDYPFADFGVLGAKGYGAVVMPYCWQGRAPNTQALLEVFLEQFGEEYPTPFVTQQMPLSRNGVSGLYLSGEEHADGERYLYEFRVASNEHCAYVLGTWGPAALPDTRADSFALWESIRFLDVPAVFGDEAPQSERRRNAFFLNQTGMHYYEARSYREAFRFLSQASDLDPGDTTYVMNALRVLAEIDAYQEAYDWLLPRLEQFPGDTMIRSWDAWLAYQTGDTPKSMSLYAELFAEGYRDDDEFAVYMQMLANDDQWDRLDAEFERYAGVGMSDALERLNVKLLTRRESYDEALAMLDGMATEGSFDAELVYARIEILDAMGDFGEVQRLAQVLIDNDYESLESWFWKGYAEFQLRSYLKARESFEKARGFSATAGVIKEYLDAIDGILGEGDNTSISAEVAAVVLPDDLEELLDNPGYQNTVEGYGAFFLNRVVGFEFDGGERVRKSHFQQIKILDGQGAEQFSTLEFNFDPAFELLYVNSLVVRDENGAVVAEGDPDAYYVTTTVDGYEASTEQTAHLPVPGLAPGVVIDVVVSKLVNVEKGEMPLDVLYLASNRPIEYSAVFVTGDRDDYAFESFAVDEPRPSGRSMVWEIADPVVYRWEPMQPYYDRLLPWVYIGTTSADWNVAGAAYFARIADKLNASRIADTAMRLVRGVEDENRRIELLAGYVQKELRYEAIEFGRRAYIPKTARETLRDRYGDCKDHAVLLYTMLNAVGIPAELALVNLNQQVLPGLPNVDQFDHMIVSVPRDGQRLFIDATDKDYSLGARPPRYMAGNHALVIGESSELVAIPDFEVGDSSLRVEREVRAVSPNEITVSEIGTFSGFQAAELRGQLRGVETSEMLATMQRWVASRYADAVVEDTYVDHLLEAEAELIVELEYRVSIDSDQSFRMPGFFEAEYLDYDRVADRRFVFDLPVPFSVSSITTVRQSPQTRFDLASKKPDAGESRFANWSRNIDATADGLVFNFEYVGRKSEFGADDYGDFTEFHRELLNSIEQPLIVE
jgi:tetratricopeptide (TPR) repeat protein